MPTFADLKQQSDNVSQIRKILEGVAFYIPMTVPVPAALTDTTKALMALPVGAVPLGVVSKEGYKFSAEATKEETEAFGYAEAVRKDVVKMPRSIELTVLQSLRRPIIEIVRGLDLSGKVAAANGEVAYDELPVPSFKEGRILIIGRDGVGSREYLQGRCYTRTQIADPPEEAWGENAQSLPMKFDVLTDYAAGTPCRHYIGGKGFDATAHGWTATP